MQDNTHVYFYKTWLQMLQSHSLMQKVNSIFNNYMFFYKLIFILGKAVMQNFSLTKAANHIFRIGDQ